LGTANGLSTSPAWQMSGEQGDECFGTSVSGAGDVNNDGFDDVVVGAFKYDSNGKIDAGAVFVYLGTANGLSTSPAWQMSGEQGVNIWALPFPARVMSMAMV
jgi:hypothetical protein